VNRTIGWLLLMLVAGPSLRAQEWSPEDDSFDPSIHSVVIGNSSWIGDPSPFIHLGSSRTGYTHVHTTNYEGFPPAVAIALMVPGEPGDTEPPAGGILMFDQEQAADWIATMERFSRSEESKPSKPLKLNTAMKGAQWELVVVREDGKRLFRLNNQVDNKTETYQFSQNAVLKLLGAAKHSLKKLAAAEKP
jgi:hypothetical protein